MRRPHKFEKKIFQFVLTLNTQQFQVKLGDFCYDFEYKTYKTLQENSIFILKRCVLEYKNIQYANIYFSRG